VRVKTLQARGWGRSRKRCALLRIVSCLPTTISGCSNHILNPLKASSSTTFLALSTCFVRCMLPHAHVLTCPVH
jgi:hypothetical protein